MTVLVAYATRHGATKGIAERIGTALRDAGLSADVKAVADVEEPARYEAFVIGSAAYMGHWLEEASSFVRRHREVLAERPVWLFSSGPLGSERIDERGRDALEVSRPEEFDEFHEALQPLAERVFFGAWDPKAPPIGLAERLQRHLPASWTDGVAGDFREWPAIESWAAAIASTLRGDRPREPSDPLLRFDGPSRIAAPPRAR